MADMSTNNTKPPKELSIAEEDAYANLLMVAADHASDSDKRKLIKAGYLPDPDEHKQLTSKASSIDDNQTAVTSAHKQKSPPAVLPTSHARVRAIRYLIARANGETYRKAVKASGADWLDIQKYRWRCAEYAVVFDFVERQRNILIAAKASDALESLIDGDATCDSRNAKAVMFALERLKREQYADPKKGDSRQGSGGGGVVYNITFQGVPAPNLCGQCVDSQPTHPIIEVKSE